MKNLTATIFLTVAVLLGSAGMPQAHVGMPQAEGIGEFICKNFQTLNIDNAGEVVDQNLATDSSATKFVIANRKVATTYPAEGGEFSTKAVHHGKWTTSKKGTHTFLVDESKGGLAFTEIQWAKYGLGTFRNYGVNRLRVSLYKCMKFK